MNRSLQKSAAMHLHLVDISITATVSEIFKNGVEDLQVLLIAQMCTIAGTAHNIN